MGRGRAGRGSREDGSVQEQDIIVLPGLEVEGKEMRKGYITEPGVQGIAASHQLCLPLGVLLGWPQGSRSFSMIMGLNP